MRFPWAVLIDLVCVLAFVLIGRSSHGEGNALLGLATTLWPFAAALAAGWLLTRAWRAPAAVLRTGVGVWVVTVAGGMALRAVTDAGTAPSFVVVTSVFLGVTLLGWRAVATAVLRRRPGRATPAASR
ncbi:DUF3054 domain-containing protein [Marinactinospora endophytica]